MKPLHQILPALEDAVGRRVVDPFVQSLDEGELRGLVYKIVDTYRRRLADPLATFEELATAAYERKGKVLEEKQDGLQQRALVLDRLLHFGALAMPAIGGPVRTLIQRHGDDQQYTLHPLLRGIELAGNRKQLNGSDGVRAIAGRTWWIIAMAGQPPMTIEHPPIDVRWAIFDHTGSLDAKACGEERIIISLSDQWDLAAQVNDRIVGEMIISLATQLRRATEGNGTEFLAARTKLEAALMILDRDNEATH
jgi:hypothetical protein